MSSPPRGAVGAWPYDATTLATEARRLPRHPDEDVLVPAAADALGAELAAEVAAGRWWPSPARLFGIKKRSGGERVVGKLVRRDRVLQRAILLDLNRLPEPPAGVTSYVRGRGGWATVSWLEARLARPDAPATWSLDVVDFFPSIELAPLRAQVTQAVPAGMTRTLVLRCLEQPVHSPRGIEVPARGLLQGGVLSGWLSNLALVDVDRRFAGTECHRYCDNLFVAGRAQRVRQQVVGLVAALGDQGLRVRLKPPEPSSAEVGIDCLGHRVSAQGRAPGRDRMAAFFDRMLSRLAAGDIEAAGRLAQGHRAFYGTRTWRGVMEIDDLLRAGRFAEALDRLRAEQARLALIEEALELSAEETALLLAAVGGDRERHVEHGGRGRTIVPRGLTPADLARHRAGEVSLGVLPVDPLGFARVGVVDVDGGTGADTAADALRVAAAVRAGGRAALVEQTGGRGHHVWVPLQPALPARRAAQLLEAATREVGPPADGVRREVFPSPPDRDPAVRLPLGLHPTTGRRSQLLTVDGQTLARGAELRAVLAPPEAVPEVRSPAARAVLEGCPLLAELAREARTTGDLGHEGRYSLASVLAAVPGGVEAVHALIAWCSDYDHEVTQGFVDRLHPRPLGCKRLRERHPHLATLCQCPRTRAEVGYPSPAAWGVLEPGRPDRRRQTDEVERLMAGLGRSLARLRQK